MKSLFLFSTRLRVYWVLIPVAALLAICIHYNSYAEGIFMLYPLIILLIAGIIFICIYFFRGIRISYDEIRHIGFFSRRDIAVITEGKSLILEKNHGRLSITLFGNDGVLPGLDWIKSTTETPRDIPQFRGNVIWYGFSIKRIMRFFDIDNETYTKLINKEIKSIYTELVTVTQDNTDGKTVTTVRINKTI